MKFLTIKSVSAALMTSALLLSACTDLTDGYSTDPVNITDESVITTDKFLSGTEVSLIGIYEGDMNRLTGMWTGAFSAEDRQYIGLSNYGVSGRDFNTEWGGVYASVIKNAHIVKSRARTEKNTRMLAIAQAIEAMAAGLAADLWGDVPFTEMSQYPTISTPKYDLQASVYNNVQVLLDSAIANFATEVPAKLLTAAANADFFLAADGDAWTAVCNTLKARYFLHTRDYVSAQTYAAMGVQDPSGSMLAPHGQSYLQNFNLFYSFTNYDRPGYMAANNYEALLLDPASSTSRNNSKTDESSRFNYLFMADDGFYDINWLTDFDYDTPTEYNGFFAAETSFPLVTFEENQLILAEALIKQNNAVDALDALNTVRAWLDVGGNWAAVSSGYLTDKDYNGGHEYDPEIDPVIPFHNYMPYDLTDFAPGGIENADNIAANDALLREILEERYVSLTGQLEVFNDVRRTGNYLGVPVKAGNTTIPLRLLYPQSEINTNPNIPNEGVGLFDATTINKTAY